MSRGLTTNQRAILAAIETGQATLEDIRHAAGIRSKSVVRYNLHQLAARGMVVLDSSRGCTRLDTGAEYCAGWNAACRLMGNQDA